MGMQINTNVSALNAYRNLSSSQNDLSKSLERLSSGFRINRAADDAAGLAISEGLRAQIGGYKVAARNAQDGVSLVQTAEGALTEVHSILQRLRDLSVQAANDSNNTESRTAITNEASQLQQELSRIASSTNFNGQDLLKGGSLNFQVGAEGNAENRITVNLANVQTVAAALGVGGGASYTVASAPAVTAALTFSFGTDANADGDFGDAGESGAGSVTIAAKAGGYASVDDLVSALNGNDAFSANLVATKSATGALVVKSTRGYDVAIAAPGTGVAAGTVSAAGIAFTSHELAQDATQTIDAQIEVVSTARSNLGAYQNRFESAIKSVNVSLENLSASESRIRDTDMASEMVNFTRSQILQQAGTAMLAQANQVPQGVLQLLR